MLSLTDDGVSLQVSLSRIAINKEKAERFSQPELEKLSKRIIEEVVIPYCGTKMFEDLTKTQSPKISFKHFSSYSRLDSCVRDLFEDFMRSNVGCPAFSYNRNHQGHLDASIVPLRSFENQPHVSVFHQIQKFLTNQDCGKEDVYLSKLDRILDEEITKAESSKLILPKNPINRACETIGHGIEKLLDGQNRYVNGTDINGNLISGLEITKNSEGYLIRTRIGGDTSFSFQVNKEPINNAVGSLHYSDVDSSYEDGLRHAISILSKELAEKYPDYKNLKELAN